MVGLLRGGAKALFGELLTPLYLEAQLTARGSAYDGHGTMQITETVRPCRARVDSATERMRSADGFTETDRAISVLASSLDGTIDTDAELEVLEGDYAGKRFGIASVDRPPGGSYFLCRGTARG